MLSEYASTHLRLAVEKCDDLARFCRQYALERTLGDSDLLDACIRKAEVAAGSLYQVRDREPGDYARIAALLPDSGFWSGVDRLRHKLAHDYLRISAELIYEHESQGLFRRLREAAQEALDTL